MVSLPPAIRRLCLIVDVEKYSTRRNAQAVEVQGRLSWVMDRARDVAGVNPRACARQDSGDGQLLLLPAGIDEGQVVPRLVRGLHSALHRVNQRPGDAGRLRLRAALTQGIVHTAATGYVGDAVVAASRFVDSAELRSALSGTSGTDLVVMVADDLYRDVIAQGYAGIDPGSFRRLVVDVPAKGFSEPAWIHVPAGPPDRHLVPRFTGRERSGLSLTARVAIAGAGAVLAGGDGYLVARALGAFDDDGAAEDPAPAERPHHRTSPAEHDIDYGFDEDDHDEEY